MCGRFALFTPPGRIAKYFQATLGDDVDPDQRPSWNVAPTDTVFGLRQLASSTDDAGARILHAYRWGLVPWWSKDPTAGSRLFNARGETVANKPSFRSAFQERRLVIPADGFYEWHKPTHGAKQPHYFTRTDGEQLAFAGLWEQWRSPQSDEVIQSCTIITTPASQDMDGVHSRMPVVLEPSAIPVWLDPENDDRHELESLVRAAPVGTITHYPVGNKVGSVRNNGPELINPAETPFKTPTE